MDGIERKLDGQADVLRIDLLSTLGRKLALEHGVALIPAILVLDTRGRVVLRQAGLIQPQAIYRAIDARDLVR